MSKCMIAAFAMLAATASGAMAKEVKVGVILPYTGIGAEFAQQIDRGMEQYLKLNADQVKPYTITVIKRDSKAPNGAEAKVGVQELLTQDKVDALAGFVYSPDAIASAPVIAAGTEQWWVRSLRLIIEYHDRIKPKQQVVRPKLTKIAL